MIAVLDHRASWMVTGFEAEQDAYSNRVDIETIGFGVGVDDDAINLAGDQNQLESYAPVPKGGRTTSWMFLVAKRSAT